MATQSQTITAPGTTNWLCPDGVYSVQVELWGSGGTGGPATGTASGGGGGAGGQYALKQVPVIPGTSYAVVVAAAAIANTTNVVNGNDTTFASTTVVAKGGVGGAKATAATSLGGVGSSASGVGDTVNAGGSGGNGVSSTVSGGGGGGAGSTGIGNSGSGQTAGLAKSNNGGAGGTGVSVANTNNVGNNYGGGGSGGLSNTSTDRAGGNGAQGLAVITWTNPPAEALKDDFTGSRNANKWTQFGVALGTLPTQAGTLVFTTSTTNGYGGYDSVEAFFDLTGSYIAIQVVNAGNQALTSLEVVPVSVIADASNQLKWYINSGAILVLKKVAGVQSTIFSTTYNSTTHQWLKIRESGGTLFFDYSADGFSWTNAVNLANPFAIDAFQTEISVGTFANEASGTTVTMDNYNSLPPVGRDIQDSENTPGAVVNQAPQRAGYW